MIVSDNGTELTCNAMLAWCSEAKINWHSIAPGKPRQNGCAESFNGRMRDERTTTRSGRTQPLDTKPQRHSPLN
jgi:transposase InsO family protein